MTFGGAGAWNEKGPALLFHTLTTYSIWEDWGRLEKTAGIRSYTRNRKRLIDLGFSAAEARNLKIRSDMMTALDDFITSQKLTQARAAKLLNVTQPRISDLMRGRIDP